MSHKEKKMSNSLYVCLGICLPFILTTIGSSLVYVFKSNINKKISAVITGFSAGIMIAASVWSLILPSFSYDSGLGKWNFLPAIIGILIGCFLILLIDIIIHKFYKKEDNLENKNLTRFIIAFTMHNIPEGLAVGFAFGNALATHSQLALIGAMGLTIGISLQNLPEGAAVSLPVYQATKNKTKAFFIGSFSGIVEPIFAVIGLLLATYIESLIPWLLCFSAGAMIFVTIEDLVPESKLENSHIGTWGFILGFILMMLLDICLG